MMMMGNGDCITSIIVSFRSIVIEHTFTCTSRHYVVQFNRLALHVRMSCIYPSSLSSSSVSTTGDVDRWRRRRRRRTRPSSEKWSITLKLVLMVQCALLVAFDNLCLQGVVDAFFESCFLDIALCLWREKHNIKIRRKTSLEVMLATVGSSLV